MKQRVLPKIRTSAPPPQVTQASSPLLHQKPSISEQSQSLGNNSNLSKELGGIQPKTIRRSLNWQNISVEAPSRSAGRSLPGGIQLQQGEPPAVIGETVSTDSAQKSPLESSNSTISTSEPAQKSLIARTPFNGRDIPVEAPPRSALFSYSGGIQRLKTSGVKEQEKSTESVEMQAEQGIHAKSSEGELQEKEEQPKTIRRSLNWQNISVEAPSRNAGRSLPGGIQRQQQEPSAVIGSQVSADSAQKTALESSDSTISASEPAQKPLIARAPFNGRNIPVEAPPRSEVSSAYPEGIQRLETSGVKEQEKSTESVQMQPLEEIQAKSTEGEPQEKEEQNKELVQTKLTIGAPGDKYEQEADSMAAKVMTMPDSAIQQPIQRQTGEDTEAVQMQPLVNSISPLVQRKPGEEEEVQMKSEVQRASDGSSVASSSIENRLASSKGGGSPLPDSVRRFMEPRFGADFSNIKVHTDSNAVQMNKEVGAQAFAHGGDIYYGAGKSPGNNELTAHELTHTIQQGAAGRMNKEVRRQPQQEEEQETIQAKEISISGQEKSAQVSLSNKESSFQASEAKTETLAAKALSSYNTNHYLNKELRQKPQEQEQETTQEEPIQTKQFANSPLSSNSPSSSNSLSSSNKDTIQLQPLAVTSVSPHIQGDFLGIGNPIDKIKAAIAGFAKQLPGYSLLKLILGKDPISGAPVQRNATNLIRGILGLVPNGDKIFNNLQQSGTLQKSFDWFNGEVAKLNLTSEAIKGLFGKALKSLGITDAINPMGAFEKVKNVFVEPIGRIKNFAVSAGKKVMEFAFEGFLNRAGGAGAKVMGILRKAGGAFSSILKDPVGFCGNLVGAVRGGCQKFSGNAATHLKNGLTGWLFGALAGAGLTLPAQFDTKGIVSVVLQVLGATYERLRGKLANKIGEQKVGRLEKTFDFLRTIVTGGLGAAWQKISEFAGNLQEMVIGGIKEWVMQSVITSSITKLVSMFNPAGAIIQAVMAIYNTVMFFIERGSQIAALAEAVFNSIGSIAAGNVAGAANYVEQTMGRSIPVMISFLARLLGLGGISEHIKNVIKKIQAPIENAMNKLADFIVQKGATKGDRSSNSQPVKPNSVERKNQKPVPNNRQNPQPTKPNSVGQNNQKPVPNNRSEREQQQQAKLDHDRKVKKGLVEIKAEEKKILKGMIGKPEAQSIAAKVKRNNPIFKSITVIDGRGTWDYKWIASEGTEKGTLPQQEWLDIGKKEFPHTTFTLQELLDKLVEKGRADSTKSKTLLRAMNVWLKENEAYRLMSKNSPQYTFDPELVNSDVSKPAKRFTEFKTESAWKPIDQGNEPVFGHPTKNKDNSYPPYQISSNGSFQNSNYRKFFKEESSNFKGDLSPKVASDDINYAIENKLLSKVGSSEGKTYAITEGEKPGYSTYVMKLNIPTPNRKLPDEVREEIINIIKQTELELDPQLSSWNTETNDVWIKLTSKTYRDIETVLKNGQAKEIKAQPEVAEDIKKMYATWQKINNQEDWHHTWPKWLGGAEIQTPKLHIPRWIHDFGGDKLEIVAFHQHLHALWKDSEFYREYKVPYGDRTEFQEAFRRAKEKQQNFKEMVKDVLLEAYKRTFQQADGKVIIDKISEFLNQELEKVVIPEPKTKKGK